VLKRPLLRSGSIRSGGYSFLGTCASAAGEADFLGEDDDDTAGDLSRNQSGSHRR
jgi:hypothetical protein